MNVFKELLANLSCLEVSAFTASHFIILRCFNFKFYQKIKFNNRFLKSKINLKTYLSMKNQRMFLTIADFSYLVDFYSSIIAPRSQSHSPSLKYVKINV